MADRMMTSSMTSHDLEMVTHHSYGQCRDSDNFCAYYLKHGLRYRLGYYGASRGNF